MYADVTGLVQVICKIGFFFGPVRGESKKIGYPKHYQEKNYGLLHFIGLLIDDH